MVNQKIKPADQKTVVILGSERSGTSVTAGLLKILGVNIGENLKIGDNFNIKGYFEDTKFIILNTEILEKTGGNSHNPPSYAQILDIANDKDLVNKIKAAIKKDVPLWGWKEPRTSFTIELYLPYLINPHFIVCFRNPHETAKSIAEGTGYNVLKSLRLTNMYNDKIISFFEKHRHLPKIFISFEKITKNPLVVAKKLSDFIGTELTESKQRQIKKFIVSEDIIQKERVRIADLEAKRELQQIYDSRSWKIISFLRQIKKSIPVVKNL